MRYRSAFIVCKCSITCERATAVHNSSMYTSSRIMDIGPKAAVHRASGLKTSSASVNGRVSLDSNCFYASVLFCAGGSFSQICHDAQHVATFLGACRLADPEQTRRATIIRPTTARFRSVRRHPSKEACPFLYLGPMLDICRPMKFRYLWTRRKRGNKLADIGRCCNIRV